MKEFNLCIRESKIIKVKIKANDLYEAIDKAEYKYSNGEYDSLMENGDYEAPEVFED